MKTSSSIYLVSGHSGEIDPEVPQFVLPNTCTIKFAAEKGQACFAPSTNEDFDMILNDMNNRILADNQLAVPGSAVDNYIVSFNEKQYAVHEVSDGIYPLTPYASRTGTTAYNRGEGYLPSADMSLREVVDLLVRTNRPFKNKPFVLYCVFCRGSDRSDLIVDLPEESKIHSVQPENDIFSGLFGYTATPTPPSTPSTPTSEKRGREEDYELDDDALDALGAFGLDEDEDEVEEYSPREKRSRPDASSGGGHGRHRTRRRRKTRKQRKVRSRKSTRRCRRTKRRHKK